MPLLSRNATRSSPNILTRSGTSSSSSAKQTGCQKRRRYSPPGVPAPTCVNVAFSAGTSPITHHSRRCAGSGESGADLLALKEDVGAGEDQDHLGDEAGELRPDQEETLRRRQRRAEERPLDLAVEHRAQGARRRLQKTERDLGEERVRRDPVDCLQGV